MTKKEIMGEEAWLKLRKEVITATEAASLFGLNPYRSGASIMREKEEPPEILDNSWITVGQWLEPVVVKATNKLLDRNFKLLGNGKKVFYTFDRFQLGATPDAADDTYFLECKTTRPGNLSKWEYCPPLYYLLQLHVQMVCGEKDHGYLSIMSTDLSQHSPKLEVPMIIFETEFNRRIFDLLGEECNRFWECVRTRKKFRVNSKMKDEMTMLLKLNYTKVR
jgi:predicted phage-related endonuclease